jgi:peptidoglycan-associated lipoprotein
MRRFVGLLAVGALAVALMLTMAGCGSKPEVETDVTEPDVMQEDTSALTGEDIPLSETPDDVVYVDPSYPEFENIHFEFDRYYIRDVDKPILERISGWLKDNENTYLLIEGHCDERGTNEYNMALGEQRALSARRYLVGLGIDADRISTISYGEERPLDPRSTEEAWAKNRRAHFNISQ